MEGPVGRGWNLGAVLAQRDLSLCSGEASCAESAQRGHHPLVSTKTPCGLTENLGAQAAFLKYLIILFFCIILFIGSIS